MQRISLYVKNPKKFCDNLKKYDGYVSGSFMLAVLYDQNIYNDIDIYEYTPSGKMEFKENGDSRYLQFLQYLYKECGFATGNPPHRSNDYNDDNAMQATIRVSNSTGNPFQHIASKIDPLDLIYQTYDMDICKNVFNGKKLRVKSWYKLITKKDDLVPTYYITHGKYGILSGYQDIVITPDQINEKLSQELEVFIEKSKRRTYERLEKYNARGYIIKIHPNWENCIKKIYDFFFNEQTIKMQYTSHRFSQQTNTIKILESREMCDILQKMREDTTS
jgi:hypothetical protein